MPTLIIGVLVLVAALWALGKISKVDPKIAARVVKASGGILCLLFAVFLFLRGEIGFAIPLGAFGLGLLGWLPFGSTNLFDRTRKSRGQVSRVRTAFLEMELDHDSGAMRGRVLAGPHQGATLDGLSVGALTGMLADIDDDSRSLLAAYLDRRHPRWREDAQGDPAAGRAASLSGKMTEEEAYQILGVARGASERDISRAHRALMKKLHPDQGGSTYLAARVNEAKEVLFRRHR
ncbi:MAG TPA: DnaJ domain-containing protein [Pseudolabrys sp.]|nr:DnaJ domain-containing protein [Pseudolabrys sp.]